MARTVVPITSYPGNTATAEAAGTAIDATNHHYFTPTHPLDEYVIRVVNTTSSTKAATVKAGDNPPADAAGQGDLSVSLTDGSSTPTVKYVTGLSSARFIQNDGTVNIDIASGMTGFITVFRSGRNA